jgi:hypothetical protein
MDLNPTVESKVRKGFRNFRKKRKKKHDDGSYGNPHNYHTKDS